MWIDAGISNTVHIGYFTHDNVLDYITDSFKKFSFVCFPYDGKVEIHGFEYGKICQYAGDEVDMVARAGFFGGPKNSVTEINSLYYSMLLETLSGGLMGTEESIFTILPGIVDTDQYTAPVNFPFVFNDPSFEGLIPKGTPIAQVIPIKRESWGIKIGNQKDYNEQRKNSIKLQTKFFDRYKSMFWTRKEYK